jgi:hypothetical protein
MMQLFEKQMHNRTSRKLRSGGDSRELEVLCIPNSSPPQILLFVDGLNTF